MFADLVVFTERPDEVALVAHLQRGGRDYHCIVQGIHLQPRVDELVGEQRVIFVGEARFQLDGAGGGINLVVGLSSEPVVSLFWLVRSRASTLTGPAFAP